jgi:hypothetical protein
MYIYIYIYIYILVYISNETRIDIAVKAELKHKS